MMRDRAVQRGDLGWLLTVMLAVVAVAVQAGPVWAQGCPKVVGYEGFGGLNQAPRDVAIAGHLAYTADDHGLTVYDLDDPTKPTKLGELLLPESAKGIAVSGNLACVADGKAGLQIVDIGTPSRPVLLGSLDTPGDAFGVAISGDLALVADSSGGLQILDISDPLKPQSAGSYETYTAVGVAAGNGIAYLADYAGGLKIIDISDPSNPSLLGSFSTSRYAVGVTVAGGRAHVAEGSTLEIVDVSNPSNPALLGSYHEAVLRVAVAGSIGYLTTGYNLEIVNIADPAHVTKLGTYATSTQFAVEDAALMGTTVCTVGSSVGLSVIDASNPSSPVLQGAFDTRGGAAGVVVSGSAAYVADGSAGLQTVDVSQPSGPVLLGGAATSWPAEDLAVAGGVACVAIGRNGVQIVDVSDAANPATLTTYDTPGSARDVAIAGSYAYVADESKGLLILDISDPAHPVAAGSYDTASFALGVAVAGHLAYVADGNDGLQILDAGDPAHPTLAGGLDTPGTASAVAVSGGVAYVADDRAGLQIIDVTDPSSPSSLSNYDTPGRAVGVAVSGDAVYVADGDGGLQILNVTDPADPVLVTTVATARDSYDVALDLDTGTAWLADGPLLEGVALECATCPTVHVNADPAEVTTGGSAATITVTLADGSGTPLPGKTVGGSVASGGLSVFTDRGDGSYTATFTSGGVPGWVEIDVTVDGSSCEGSGWIHVVFAPDPPLDGDLPSNLAMIPGSAHVNGAGGTAWRSDAVLHNPGSRAASAALFFLETGRDNSAATGQVISVAPGASVALDDLVRETFGASTSGAIFAASDEPLLATSRTYNDLVTRTYGQFVPGLALTKAIGSGEKVRLIQLSKSPSPAEGFRTNIGFANASGSPLHVTVALYAVDGTPIASPDYTLQPWSFYQKTRILPTAVEDAYAVVSSDSAGARYFTYASVVDNGTGDPTFVQPVPATEGIIVVPAAAHVKGAAGTNWKTDLEVHNPGSSAVELKVEMLARDQANPSPPSKRFTVEAGRSLRLTDLLDTVFNFSGAAALRVTPYTGALMVTSRTYNDVTGGTFGQFIPGQPKAAGELIAGGSRLIQLSQSASNDEGFRTNIGLTNAKARTTEVDVELFSGDGTALGTVHQTLAAYEFVQIDKIFRKVTGDTVDNGYAVISSSTEGAAVFAYASVVDNRSGDPFNIPALY